MMKTFGEIPIFFEDNFNYHSLNLKERLLRGIKFLGPIEGFFPKGGKVLFKPNLVTAMLAEKGGITHPLFLAALCEICRDFGATPYIGDGPAFGSTRGILHKAGSHERLFKTDPIFLDFEKGGIQLPGDGIIFKTYPIPKEIKEMDVLINCGKLKSHSQMTITLAIKNLYGVIAGKHKALGHFFTKNDPLIFSRMLLHLSDSLNFDLHLIDGVTAMEGQGPTSGTPRNLGWVAGCSNPLALEVLLAHALSLPLDNHFVLRQALIEKRITYEDLTPDLNEISPLSDFKWAPRPMEISFNPLRIIRSTLKHLFFRIREKFEDSRGKVT